MKLFLLLAAFCASAVFGQTYSAVATSDITHSSVKIVWTTSTSVNTYIKYGTTASYGSANDCSYSTTAHECWITGLNASTTYHYEVCANSSSCSGTDRTFATIALPSPHPSTPTLPTSPTLPAVPTVWATDVLVSSCAQIQTEINTAAAADGSLNYRIRIPVSYDCSPGVPSGEGWGNTSPLYLPAKSGSNPSGTGWIVVESASPPTENVRITLGSLSSMPIIRTPPALQERSGPPTTGTCASGQLYWNFVTAGWGLYACTTPGTNTYTLVAKTDFSGSGTSCSNQDSWYYKTDAVSDDASMYWCTGSKLYRVHIGTACTDFGSMCLAANAHHYRFNGIQFMPVPLQSSGTIPQWYKDLYTAEFAFAYQVFGGSNSGVHDIILDRNYFAYQWPYRIRNIYYGLTDNLRVTNNYILADYGLPALGDSTGCNPCHTAAVQFVGGSGALVDNNYIESSGITLLASDDATVVNNDITITRNTIVNGEKHRSGTSENTTYCAGCFFASRHAIELKNGQRWLIERNAFSRHFTSTNNQADLITLSQRPGANRLPISDVTIRYNTADYLPNFLYVQAHNDFNQMATTIARVLVDSNAVTNIDGALYPTGGSARQGRAVWLRFGPEDVTVTRNLFHNVCTGYAPWFVEEESGPAEGLIVRDNISWSCAVSAPYYWIGKISTAGGISGLNAGWPASTGWTVDYNAIVEPPSGGGGLNTGSGYPTGNYYTTVAAMDFVSSGTGNYRLNTSSPFKAGSATVANVSGPSSINADLGPDWNSIYGASYIFRVSGAIKMYGLSSIR